MRKYLILPLSLAIFLVSGLMVTNSASGSDEYPNPFITAKMDGAILTHNHSPTALDMLTAEKVTEDLTAKNPGSTMFADRTAVKNRQCLIIDLEKSIDLCQSGIDEITENSAEANTCALKPFKNEDNSTNVETMWTSSFYAGKIKNVGILRTQVNAKIPNLIDDENISVNETAAGQDIGDPLSIMAIMNRTLVNAKIPNSAVAMLIGDVVPGLDEEDVGLLPGIVAGFADENISAIKTAKQKAVRKNEIDALCGAGGQVTNYPNPFNAISEDSHLFARS